MLTKINGSLYTDLLESGIKNLDGHKTTVNDLNVFPVPDGDTGTNMVMTLKHGLQGISNESAPVSEIARQFAAAAVFGARGNSGVILSQFFEGVANGLSEYSEIGAKELSSALCLGYKKAYASVAKPVEGTMLTVLKDAANAAEAALPLDSIDRLIEVYLKEARASLDRTPSLLPILKKAGVVDSGGSGIVYFFEGMEKFLRGEDIESEDETESLESFDFSRVNRDTVFDFGYCIEGLIQVKLGEAEFDFDVFRKGLERCGNSVVTTLAGDKVKIHIHSKRLSTVMEYCQSIGEFLTVKIENMTLQNMQRAKSEPPARKFLYTEEESECEFAVVAVATNAVMQKLFFEMGADVVIMSDIAPSSQDFMDAFEYTSKKKILVFPNSSNSVLTSMQAGGLYKKSHVSVLNCRSAAECYAALSVMDFSASRDDAITQARATIGALFELSVYHAGKNVKFGKEKISKGDYFALSKNKILSTGPSLEEVALGAVRGALEAGEYGVVTVFYNEKHGEDFAESLARKIESFGFPVDVATISAGEYAANLTVILE